MGPSETLHCGSPSACGLELCGVKPHRSGGALDYIKRLAPKGHESLSELAFSMLSSAIWFGWDRRWSNRDIS